MPGVADRLRRVFGGVLALEYAARYGHRLDRLIVQGAGARFEHTLLQAVAGTVLNRFPLPADNPSSTSSSICYSAAGKSATPCFISSPASAGKPIRA